MLPKGFVRIRNFGFLANRRRATLLPLCYQLLGSAPQTELEPSTADDAHDLRLCPRKNGIRKPFVKRRIFLAYTFLDRLKSASKDSEEDQIWSASAARNPLTARSRVGRATTYKRVGTQIPPSRRTASGLHTPGAVNRGMFLRLSDSILQSNSLARPLGETPVRFI